MESNDQLKEKIKQLEDKVYDLEKQVYNIFSYKLLGEIQGSYI